jgi:multimeric flavodoxin WrbA
LTGLKKCVLQSVKKGVGCKKKKDFYQGCYRFNQKKRRSKMKTIKILGISGSPRKNGNTDYLVQMALLAAGKVKGVETEFVHLGDYKYKSGCIGCMRCDKEPSLEKLCYIEDDHNTILRKEIEADGFIWGCPVYYQGLTSQFKMWIDRHECMGSATGAANRNKPVGCVTVGMCRSGGQAQAIEDMFRFAYMLDAIPIGAGAVGPFLASAGIHGACGVTCGWPETQEQEMFSKEEKTWVKYDRLAIGNALVIGERVAEMAKVIEAGFSICNPENGETRWPVHRKPPQMRYVDLVGEYEGKGWIPKVERLGTVLTYIPAVRRAEFGYKPSEDKVTITSLKAENETLKKQLEELKSQVPKRK